MSSIGFFAPSVSQPYGVSTNCFMDAIQKVTPVIHRELGASTEMQIHRAVFSAGAKVHISLQFCHVKTGALAFSKPNARFGYLPV